MGTFCAGTLCPRGQFVMGTICKGDILSGDIMSSGTFFTWGHFVHGDILSCHRVSSLTASACHIGGRTDVNPGEQTLVYGTSQN